MTPEPAGIATADAGRALALLAAVARQLNSGRRPLDTLAAVVDTVRAQLGAREAAIWVHEPNATTFARIAAPRGAGSLSVPSLDALPSPAGDVRRVALERGGDRLGMLEIAAGGPDGGPGLLQLLADVLTPYLAATELAEDLAFEVAVQSREMEEQRRFTGLIIDSLTVGLYVVDRDYRIQVWNRKRETGTQGLRREQVVGRPIFDVLTRQDPAELRAQFDFVFATGETIQQEIEVVLGGETHYFRTTKIPMRLDGDAITHVITIGEDVTDWRAIQTRILQSEKLAAVGQLAAGVMHEINNPLATINVCVAAMEARIPEADPSAATLREYLGIIEKEVQRCTSIVDGLLDFSRPKGKAMATVAVNAIVEDALFLLKHHPRFRQIELCTDLAPELAAVRGNAEQLVQVLMALLLNALDAMEGGGRLTVRTGPAHGDEVAIEVQDTGVGIARGEQSKIFEPFYTTKPPGRGTGLGLSICYGIVEQHRGRIELESQPGRGAVFRVLLPATEAA